MFDLYIYVIMGFVSGLLLAGSTIIIKYIWTNGHKLYDQNNKKEAVRKPKHTKKKPKKSPNTLPLHKRLLGYRQPPSSFEYVKELDKNE